MAHVRKGAGAKKRRREAAVKRATQNYGTYNAAGYLRLAQPSSFIAWRR